jgi:hypothetical protein
MIEELVNWTMLLDDGTAFNKLLEAMPSDEAALSRKT